MTLILGTVCDDGVVIAGDSKTVDSKTKKIASYDVKKVHRVGTIAFAMAGTGHFEETAEVLKKEIAQWLVFNSNMHLGIIVSEVFKQPEKILLTKKTNLTVIIANKDFLYLVDVSFNRNGIVKGKISETHAAIAGIDDYRMPKFSGTKTTKDYAEFFKQTIKLNRGPYVGGRTRVVILKNDKTPLQSIQNSLTLSFNNQH